MLWPVTPTGRTGSVAVGGRSASAISPATLGRAGPEPDRLARSIVPHPGEPVTHPGAPDHGELPEPLDGFSPRAYDGDVRQPLRGWSPAEVPREESAVWGGERSAVS